MLPSLTILARFEVATSRMAQPAHPAECWVWGGSVNSNGYGKLQLHRGGTWYAHRIAYGLVHGVVPAELDHLCRQRRCWRPSHLEAVSHRENLERSPGWSGNQRKETCAQGHTWSTTGWWVQKDGGRKCKECHRRAARESARRRKAS